MSTYDMGLGPFANREPMTERDSQGETALNDAISEYPITQNNDVEALYFRMQLRMCGWESDQRKIGQEPDGTHIALALIHLGYILKLRHSPKGPIAEELTLPDGTIITLSAEVRQPALSHWRLRELLVAYLPAPPLSGLTSS